MMSIWVEKGVMPSRLEASLVREGTVVRTRPLGAYDSVAVWDGRSDTDRASSFSCVSQPAAVDASEAR